MFKGSDMNQIRPWLYVGGLQDAISRKRLREAGIKAVLQLHESFAHEEIEELFLPLTEGKALTDEQIQTAVQFGRAHKAQGHTLLVACGAGISRSSLVATIILKEEEGVSLLEAFNRLRTQHHDAAPDQVMWDSANAYYHENTPFAKVWRSIL
jgi:protein-tyrosine phosphatase